jgi:hypothetical protein
LTTQEKSDCTTEYRNGKDNRENLKDHSKEEEEEEEEQTKMPMEYKSLRKRKKCIEN